ncbi:pectinesterase family protein [Actinoplanes subtropicus]|uniref:pectinesterase family protein n=1 Tax=Actinoplanes subtropicus TaxID=543632 RepID=UPI0012FABD1D|nr:pectinesterase family protein [Actinoplanes subtropicus]
MSQEPVSHRMAGRRPRRSLVIGGTAAIVGVLAAVPLIASASTSSPAGGTLTVAADGSATYKTVQAAINAVPANSGSAYKIVVGKGTYHEIITVPVTKKHLTIEGATGNPEDVVITYGNASGTSKPGGGTYGTLGSATASILAADFTAANVTIANSFNPAAEPTIKDTQAVALAAEGDRQIYRNDRFLGRQDTLLAWSPSAAAQTRQYFSSDFIAGTVDFIFGNATAVFNHANIQATDRGAAAGGLNGFLTAANTESSKKYGFLITDSTVYSSAKANTYYLGRPWHPTGTAVAQVVFRNTVLPAAIKKATPWTDMSGFSWKSARFSSYHNSGPGSGAAADSPQLSDATAADFTAQKYLAGTDGWNPVGATTGATTGATGNPTTKPAATTPATGPSPAAPAGITGDTRKVTEPTVPATTCATLTAALTISGRTFPAAQETTPPDTARLQKAIDSCTRSSGTVAVKLAAGGSNHAFLTGPLTIKPGVVLLVDSGVTLYGSRNPASYQISGKPTCGTLASSSGGCSPLITVAGANAGIEGIGDAAGVEGHIDGRGDQAILGTSTTWWGLATQAQQQNLNQNNPRLIQANKSDNFTMYDIELLNSANFHVVYSGGNGFTAWGVRIKTPANARNTDGIDPAGATNVTIANSFIQDGDDGIAIKGGQASSNITVRDSHFYGTHGISIGSETNGGVTDVLFQNNTLTGTDSSGIVSGSSTGIRIKSSPKSGGKVTNVAYLSTCETAVKTPLIFDTHYANGTGTLFPSFTGIVVDGVKVINSPKGAKSVFNGFSASLPLGLTLTNASLDVTTNTSAYADVRLANSNITPAGTGVTVTKVSSGGAVPSCTFPAFPAG